MKIEILSETAENLEDMDLPGLDLHQLKGKRKGTWALPEKLYRHY
jgi:hypothetical protein